MKLQLKILSYCLASIFIFFSCDIISDDKKPPVSQNEPANSAGDDTNENVNTTDPSLNENPAVNDPTGNETNTDPGNTGTPKEWVCGDLLVTGTHSYKTVLIQSGQYSKCWMAENLNEGERIDGQYDQVEGQKYCYGDIESNCDKEGGLYQWGKAVCPQGWHIPSDAEWHEMLYSLDNTVSAESGFSGTTIVNKLSLSGFNALMTGIRRVTPGDGQWDPNIWYAFHWGVTVFWASDEDFYYVRALYKDEIQINRQAVDDPGYGYNVRCVKD